MYIAAKDHGKKSRSSLAASFGGIVHPSRSPSKWYLVYSREHTCTKYEFHLVFAQTKYEEV